MKDIYKLDLEWQYTMLSHHVANMLKDVDEGLSPTDNHYDALRRRIELIQELRDSHESCKGFAQAAYALGEGDCITINTWPSSQICMDCEYSAFMMSEDLPGSTYACKKGVQLGPCDGHCVMFEEKLQELE